MYKLSVAQEFYIFSCYIETLTLNLKSASLFVQGATLQLYKDAAFWKCTSFFCDCGISDL